MATNAEETTVGNYFVANYPPFSFWRPEQVPLAGQVLDREAAPETPLGLYVHIPLCRKRCDFCYFRVYTDKDAAAVRRYLDAVVAEVAMYAQRPALRGRKPLFVYFGGGTPSYLSAEQLRYLFDGLQEHLSWDAAAEIAFECEPGTLQEKKIRTLRELGVTRLSLGVENFDPDILALNNRAHRAKEIYAAYATAREVGFPQINVDLIAGMVGETEANWQDCIAKVKELAPEAITLYQMEIPFNTTVYQRMKDGGERVAPVADWATKRRWVDEGFRELEGAGYVVGSAYTAAKPNTRFLYRDELWRGADMLGLGVASFSHIGGGHFQNEDNFEPYLQAVEGGGLPIHRALELSADEQLIREFVLQLKLGRIETSYFSDKFGVDVHQRFREPLAQLESDGVLSATNDTLELSRDGLLNVDRLLPYFFLDVHRDARYA